ncbi:hypothetical protein MKW94_006539 [Papaver nudicaule]|uniref:Mitochondrial import inner membrane translocase subunit n=1 Tax=Papaver nudicaule TaxID=74823 RepID=A0AA41RSN9_PAPNU|nr:hypothetical protein [Papaver nudicaule]
MDFSSPSSGSSSSGSQPSPEVFMDQLKSQLAQAYCITKPGTSLSGSESSCVSRCVDRYIEATGIVNSLSGSGSSCAVFSQQR